MIRLIVGSLIIATITIAIDTLLNFKDDERTLFQMLKHKYIVAAKIIVAFLALYILSKMYSGMVSGCNEGFKDAIIR